MEEQVEGCTGVPSADGSMSRVSAGAWSLCVVVLLALALFLAGCGRDSGGGSPSTSLGSTGTTTAVPGTTVSLETPPPELVDKALGLVQLMAEGSFAEAVLSFDDTMAAALPPEKLAEVWRTLEQQTGSFLEPSGVRMEVAGGYRAMIVTGLFGEAKIDIRVVFDDQERVAGLFFKPAETVYAPPAYVDPAAFTESDIAVETGETRLPATLSMPRGNGPFPAVVLVHGSGPNDRDETYGPNKPFRDIAQGLATVGVAVLRYDKRTFVYGQEVESTVLTVKEETVDDALAAFSLLRGVQSVDPSRTFILGHSLGATLVPRIAQEAPQAAGFVLLAAAARPLEDLILEQSRYLLSLDPGRNGEAETALAELEQQVQRVKEPGLAADTPAAELPLGIPATYWLDLRGYDPAAAATAVDQRMLIAQGGRDYQVTQQDYEMWREALSGRSDVLFAFYPELNHLFMEGQGAARPGEYLVEGHVAEVVIDDIAAFVSSAAR